MTTKVIETIDRSYKIDRQGREHVMYAGLLDAAHADITRIAVTLVQAPCEQNMQTAICSATVEMADGRVFSDIGDANPINTGRAIVPHIIRMASTRAKARALRDALNIGGAAAEELGDVDEDAGDRHAPERHQVPVRAATPQQQPAQAEKLAGPNMRAELRRLVDQVLALSPNEIYVLPERMTHSEAIAHKAALVEILADLDPFSESDLDPLNKPAPSTAVPAAAR